MLSEISSIEPNLDFILIDARAGFHDIGGFALGDLSHAAVIAGQHTKQTWAGLTHVINRLGKPNISNDEPLPSVMVHTMAPEENPQNAATLKGFREKSHDVFIEHYYSSEESFPTIHDEEAAFYPVVVPWNAHLFGDLSLTVQEDEDRELAELRLKTLVQELTGKPYAKIAKKLCDLFGKELEDEEAYE